MKLMTEMNDYASLSEVDRIAGLGPSALRNLQITQSYHEIALALAERLGASANWCIFATWASKQAGQTIRHEDLARALETALQADLDTQQAAAELAAALQRISNIVHAEFWKKAIWVPINLNAAAARAGDAVGQGNHKVYAEIGREFARFLGTCARDAAYDAASIAQFCQALRPGDPPGGQEYLRRAFSHYYEALFEPNAKVKAEWIFLANIEIGFHEQTRLQPEIATAAEAAIPEPEALLRRFLSSLSPHMWWWSYAGLWLKRLFGRPGALDLAAERLVAAVRSRIRQILTAQLMEIRFPHGVRLPLGEDLNATFPESLRQITNPDLLALLQRVDPTPDSLRDTGAKDWADLADRLHYIVDLFRSHQEAPALLEPPFSAVQVEKIKAGTVPEGEL